MVSAAADYALLFAAILVVAYLLPASVFHLVARIAPPASRIQQRAPRPGQVRREVLMSLRAVAIFALYGLGLLAAYRAGWTALDPDWSAWPWWWPAVGFLAAIILHDTWFYWVHRAMHAKRLFGWMHAQHHRSVTPTPWSILAFDVAETIPQFGIFVVLVMLVPMHPAVLGAYLLFDSMVNAAGHCGHEIIPDHQRTHWLLRYTNAVTHHDLHHSRFDCNYAQYFNIWDRLCGTFRDRDAPPAAAAPSAVPQTRREAWTSPA
ncbi:sterol desaturase family protein [Falsiroseomonas ponticola]|uniref:sterol desaturase family protein n=1 Tax=Falsiroseomonas ponticola TaxID=2786951 RepID=UPI0019330088|nr:sterol desaturase family protein [Roseomonas ponticola]